MEVEQKEYKVQEIADGFMEDDNSSEIIAMHGKLDIRPKYQREYVYTDNKRDKVIDTVLRGLPLGVMYFVERDDGTLEVLDGQQRLISICRYAKNQFSTKPPNNIISQIKSSVTFNVLPSEAKDKFNNYKLNVYVCKGSEKDKIDWFETINIAGEPLEQQEILNAVLYSKWLEDAKTYFSKRNCPAYRMYNKYMSGNYIRQDYLATVFSWHADADRDITEKDKKCKIEHYMQKHRKDENAAEVWSYFRSVFAWVNRTFKNFNEKTMKGVEWGCLFNRHKDDILDLDSIALEVEKLLEDPDVTNKHGIYEYVLNKDEKVLNIRNFSISDKVTKFNEQNGICPICGKKFEIKDMEADHITPWHEGGKTVLDNCQMLCKKCNREKGGK